MLKLANGEMIEVEAHRLRSPRGPHGGRAGGRAGSRAAQKNIYKTMIDFRIAAAQRQVELTHVLSRSMMHYLAHKRSVPFSVAGRAPFSSQVPSLMD